MPKPEPAPAPLEVSQRDALPLTGPQTVTWIPTRADTIEMDQAGNIIAVNGVPVKIQGSGLRTQDAVKQVTSPDAGDA